MDLAKAASGGAWCLPIDCAVRDQATRLALFKWRRGLLRCRSVRRHGQGGPAGTEQCRQNYADEDPGDLTSTQFGIGHVCRGRSVKRTVDGAPRTWLLAPRLCILSDVQRLADDGSFSLAQRHIQPNGTQGV